MPIIISNAYLSNIEFNGSTNEITNLPSAGVIDGEEASFLVVGAYNDDDQGTNAGAVYVYNTTNLSDTPTKLAPSELDAGDFFGLSVTVANNQIIVGVGQDDDGGTDAGAVYVFDATDLSAAPTKLVPSGIGTDDRFGWSVAATNTQIIVGAYNDDDQATNAGAVYVYDATDLSATPTKLVPNVLYNYDYFGWSVAATNTQIIVGAYRDDDEGTDAGAVYVFDATDLSATPTKLVPSGLDAGDNFGYSVAASTISKSIIDEINNPTIITEGLELFLDAENYSGTGTTWSDSSGNGNDGILVGGPTLNSENGNSYFSLDGGNDYFGTTFNPNLNNNRLYTYELWFRDDSPGVSGITTALIGNYGPSSTLPYSMLSIDSNGKVRFTERKSTGTSYYTQPANSVVNGNWRHIVAVADSNNLRIYIDGTQVASSNRPGGVITSGQNFVLGGAHYSTTRVQTADIALFRVYLDKALSASEVLENYNAEKSRFGIV